MTAEPGAWPEQCRKHEGPTFMSRREMPSWPVVRLWQTVPLSAQVSTGAEAGSSTKVMPRSMDSGASGLPEGTPGWGRKSSFGFEICSHPCPPLAPLSASPQEAFAGPVPSRPRPLPSEARRCPVCPAGRRSCLVCPCSRSILLGEAPPSERAPPGRTPSVQVALVGAWGGGLGAPAQEASTQAFLLGRPLLLGPHSRLQRLQWHVSQVRL